MKNIAVLGAGYWGKNLVRNFFQLGVLKTVCDSTPETLGKIQKDFPGIQTLSDPDSVFQDSSIQGVVIATPAVTHFDLAKKALMASKNVFVEKPLALNVSDGRKLLELAESKKRILMVGHLLQYHPGMLKLKELVEAGELGKLEYIYSNRLNLGKIRSEENILWSFAPHDISILLWLTGKMPIQVTAVGGTYLQTNVVDTTISTFVFDNQIRAHIYVSWLHPFKEQRLVVIGSKLMATFDTNAPKGEKLKLYKKNVEIVNGVPVAGKSEGTFVPFDEETEPLRAECSHFLESIEKQTPPRTDAQEGLRVLKILDSCQRSLQLSGQPVQVTEDWS